ncbi:MAG: hypothetical protein KDD11_21920, partial [Acidobacteria bacterium]|nr:hypothetical protein [Acidobacteriota bacterium]
MGAPTGPGARLSYFAGGAGGPGWPGTSEWLTHLGRYWSHDYAERIVQDPDDSHVWLITRWAGFHEFSNLSGGTYLINSPSDEYRTLRRVGAGWTLTDLDGTVETFGSNGEWLSTADRFGNAKTATYGTGGELESVDFPGGRSETFTYDGTSGKLATITEIGVDGTTSRTWTYTWNGDDLESIDVPDGRSWEFFYDDTNWPGYLTRVELVGTSGGREV